MCVFFFCAKEKEMRLVSMSVDQLKYIFKLRISNQFSASVLDCDCKCYSIRFTCDEQNFLFFCLKMSLVC